MEDLVQEEKLDQQALQDHLDQEVKGVKLDLLVPQENQDLQVLQVLLDHEDNLDLLAQEVYNFIPYMLL